MKLPIYKQYLDDQNISGNRMDRVDIRNKMFIRSQVDYTALPKLKDTIGAINTQEIA